LFWKKNKICLDEIPLQKKLQSDANLKIRMRIRFAISSWWALPCADILSHIEVWSAFYSLHPSQLQSQQLCIDWRLRIEKNSGFIA
jgi:hypothetical protein